jgi:hypothetical protein
MKLYKQLPDNVVRICISKGKEKKMFLTVCDTSQNKCIKELKQLIETQNLSVFAGGIKTNIQIREAIGSQNGKCKSISFHGMEIKEVYNLIINYLNKQV